METPSEDSNNFWNLKYLKVNKVFLSNQVFKLSSFAPVLPLKSWAWNLAKSNTWVLTKSKSLNLLNPKWLMANSTESQIVQNKTFLHTYTVASDLRHA